PRVWPLGAGAGARTGLTTISAEAEAGTTCVDASWTKTLRCLDRFIAERRLGRHGVCPKELASELGEWLSKSHVSCDTCASSSCPTCTSSFTGTVVTPS